MSPPRINPLGLPGVLEIVATKFADDRGFFSETWNRAAWQAAGIDGEFVQDNHAASHRRGTLRGLHYQLPPAAQDKLLRVTRGAIFDVAVDVRRGSPTFGKWTSLTVSAAQWNQLFVPRGFAHGYLTLEDDTEVIYKVTSLYTPAAERSVRFDDPAIGIDWPIPAHELQLSPKDRDAPLLADAEVFP
jgi:dTDP-4-dehydrorhamnose 3,5-epimerase